MLLIFGLIWMGLSAFLIREGSKLVVHLLMGATFVSLIYVGYHFATSRSFIFMDAFIASALYLLVIYGLFFVRKIMR